ncbi:MAG: hypothetical protein J6X89_01240 [Bacteroidales bacterium]|nr:hypothetical protein [Bacteroidales bacterium]
MRKIRIIFTLIAVLLAGHSCQEKPELADVTAGTGSVVFRLTSKDPIHLQTKSGADDLLDGLQFENVLVILVDNNNNVVGNVYKKYPYDPTAEGNDTDQEEVTGSSTTDDTIHFDHLNPGNYTAYAYANIDAVAWQKSGEAISDTGQEKGKVSGDFSSFLERELKAAIPVKPATAGESAMLLTGKVDVPVGLSVEPHYIYLKRPVVRFRVYINNTTPYPVRLDDLRFSHFNADRAYLMGSSDASGVPSIPAGVNYGALPAYPILDSSPSTAPGTGDVGYEEEYLVYETLLYENASPNAYKVFATLTLAPSSLNLQMSMGQREFGPIDSETLNSMDVGEQVDVLVINPRKQTRSARLYYGVSAEDNYAWESCGYESYTKLVNRVQAIFNESASHTYVGYSYNGTGSSNSGLAGWTGLTADAPLGPAPNGPTVTFDYTGANSGTPKKYFRTLTRDANGLFSISGLSSSTTSLTGMRIVQTTTSDFARFASDLPVSNLVNFIQNSSGKLLKSDCMYNESTVDKAKKTKLLWDTANNQDHKFILFGKYCAGGFLKRILKDSHKEVPLTYMSRNEDIKLVINVFYADQEATLNFDVDNSTWSTPTQSTHTFN